MLFRKPCNILYMIAAFVVMLALMLPTAARAVGIGEAILYSGYGEPLFVRVDLMTDSNERIEDSCLSLVSPDPLQKDAGSFLTEASLSLKTDGIRQYVNISSLQPLNDAHIRLRLQIKCSGKDSAIKTLDISPSASGTSIEKVSAEEHVLMLEQQKLLVTSFLAMQQQLKLLQDDLEKVKTQLSTTSAQARSTRSAIAAPQPEVQRNEAYLQDELIVAALLGTLFALWLGFHYYNKTRLLTRNGHAPSIIQPTKPSVAEGATVTSPHSLAKNIEKNVSDDDAMLEEAGLYAANGRMDKAAGILQEIIKRNPSKVDAWTLLLSVYSALCRVADFERTAQEFLRHHKDSPSWGGIQVLGRTLDRDNPLYADLDSRISSSPLLPDALNMHRPIGDVLIEMGALSKREILKYLDEFEPKRHGRFGGYLVARKAITIAQLDQALLHQQGIGAEIKPGNLPSLQDIEKLLLDFDPKQHGSVSKFLASRNIVSPEQLGQLMQHQPDHAGAAKKSDINELPVFGKLAAS